MDRETAKQKANQAIDVLADKITELQGKANEASDHYKVKYADQIADLQEKKADLEHKYDELKNSSADQFDHMKKVFFDASNSFMEGFDKLSNLFDTPEKEED